MVVTEARKHWSFRPPVEPRPARRQGRRLADARHRPLRPRPAGSRGAQARPAGRQADPDPPRDVRPDRPAADARGGRGVPRRRLARRLREGRRPPARLAGRTASGGAGTGSTWSATPTPATPAASAATSDITEAWRYRDWVVSAFNRDLPYDRFVVDQIAGDLPPRRPPGGVNADGLVATGLLAIGEWGTGDADKEKMMTDIVDDQVDVVGRAFLGLTVACARCHDHKFDPISHGRLLRPGRHLLQHPHPARPRRQDARLADAPDADRHQADDRGGRAPQGEARRGSERQAGDRSTADAAGRASTAEADRLHAARPGRARERGDRVPPASRRRRGLDPARAPALAGAPRARPTTARSSSARGQPPRASPASTSGRADARTPPWVGVNSNAEPAQPADVRPAAAVGQRPPGPEERSRRSAGGARSRARRDLRQRRRRRPRLRQRRDLRRRPPARADVPRAGAGRVRQRRRAADRGGGDGLGRRRAGRRDRL